MYVYDVIIETHNDIYRLQLGHNQICLWLRFVTPIIIIAVKMELCNSLCDLSASCQNPPIQGPFY